MSYATFLLLLVWQRNCDRSCRSDNRQNESILTVRPEHCCLTAVNVELSGLFLSATNRRTVRTLFWIIGKLTRVQLRLIWWPAVPPRAPVCVSCLERDNPVARYSIQNKTHQRSTCSNASCDCGLLITCGWRQVVKQRHSHINIPVSKHGLIWSCVMEILYFRSDWLPKSDSLLQHFNICQFSVLVNCVKGVLIGTVKWRV